MTSPNPFRVRDSERQRDHGVFVRTFGPHALDALPPGPWQKLLVIRSAPGAGKTSLMRLFTADSLRVASGLSERADPIKTRLRDMGVITPAGPALLGLYLNLDSDYRALLDLRVEPEVSQRLLFRLIDARLAIELVRASLTLVGLSYPEDAARLTIEPDGQEAEGALAKLGGRVGHEIVAAAAHAESDLLDVLDVLTADEQTMPSGHHRLYSLQALSGATISIDGRSLSPRVLVMFDDGHTLDSTQRHALLDQLRARNLRLERWYAERTEALTPEDLLGAGVADRDYEEVVLEEVFGRGGPRFRAMVIEIANRRAATVLGRITDLTSRFTDLIEISPDAAIAGQDDDILAQARSIVRRQASDEPRYTAWLEGLDEYRGRDGLSRLMELDVLICRDRERAQGELFEEILAPGMISERGSSNLREAALLRFALSRRLPYYYGTDTLIKLGSTNIEQSLNLCGDLFAEISLSISVGRDPRLDSAKQHRVLGAASDSYYKAVGVGVPSGQLVQTLIDGVARISAVEAAKPRIPYPPGVTGTALSMRDASILMEPARRKRIPGADLLYTALSSAVAYNVVSVDKDYSVKRSRYMVIYLNRLLCPRFGMPLGYGAFREKTLREIASWFVETPNSTRLSQQALM